MVFLGLFGLDFGGFLYFSMFFGCFWLLYGDFLGGFDGFLGFLIGFWFTWFLKKMFLGILFGLNWFLMMFCLYISGVWFVFDH